MKDVIDGTTGCGAYSNSVCSLYNNSETSETSETSEMLF